MRRMPIVHRTVWNIRKRYNALKRVILVRRPVVEAHSYLKHAITNNVPYAAGKMGSIESAVLAVFLKREKAKAAKRAPPAYPSYQYQTLHSNAGVFPKNVETYDKFCGVYFQAVKQCNMLVSWDIAGEAEIFSRYCQNATLVTLDSLDPFYSPHPWTSALKGKRVLVVSPFVASIAKQYAKREALWDNAEMLPAFDLLTLRAPLSAGLATPQDADWFAALERLKGEMTAVDYDVALIGAGAFSLPLAVHAKAQGKVGIHLGGSIQALFGVYGNRWTKWKYFQGFIKESWVRPSADETPPEINKIEDGCYW